MSEKKPQYCKRCEANGKQVEIKFDKEHISKNNKPYPVEVATGSGHQCPYSEYALKQAGGVSAQSNSPFKFVNPGTQINQDLPKPTSTFPQEPKPVPNYANNLRVTEIKASLDRLCGELVKLTALIGGLN